MLEVSLTLWKWELDVIISYLFCFKLILVGFLSVGTENPLINESRFIPPLPPSTDTHTHTHNLYMYTYIEHLPLL